MGNGNFRVFAVKEKTETENFRFCLLQMEMEKKVCFLWLVNDKR